MDENNCLVKTQIEVFVDKSLNIYIPNAFSPNDDGFNDIFTIYGSTSVSKVKSLRIFNRWGAVIFSANDFPPNSNTIGWDGKFKNKKMLEGVYVYLVEVEMLDGSVEKLSGELNLVK